MIYSPFYLKPARSYSLNGFFYHIDFSEGSPKVISRSKDYCPGSLPGSDILYDLYYQDVAGS